MVEYLTVTSRQKPDFSAMTAGKATFGLLGAAAMIFEGNSIIQKMMLLIQQRL